MHKGITLKVIAAASLQVIKDNFYVVIPGIKFSGRIYIDIPNCLHIIAVSIYLFFNIIFTDLNISDNTPIPLVFYVPHAPWRWFKQKWNMLELTMHLYNF